jgi:hypothetical protein
MTGPGIIPRFRKRGVTTYIDKVIGRGPVAYWPLYEVSGATAICLINAAQSGTYTGVTLGQPGIGDGNTSPSFDGTSDYCNIYSATLNAAFNRDLYTVAGWMKVSGVGVWTDGAVRYAFYATSDAVNNIVMIEKNSANNQINWTHRAGGTNKFIAATPVSPVGWVHVAMTVTLAGDVGRCFVEYSHITRRTADRSFECIRWLLGSLGDME